MNLKHPRRAIRPFEGSGAAMAVVLMLGSAAAEEDFEFFENKIRPVLAEHCFPCHSAEAEKVGGGLKLDTREDLLKGGTDGVVVVAGDPAASPLIRAIHFEDPQRQMPPPKKGGKKLPDAVIADLTRWVEAGAAYPATPPDRLKVAVKPWSFEPLTDPPPPLRDDSRALTPVDAFILADLAGRGLQLSPRADKRTLIRRASYDLTGLPPTPEETDAFLADGSPDAFAKVVERLLDSPRYGEHWGRHWLDVARYADTAGDTADYPVPEAWRYRNYVIDAFNADKPYDEFLREQIAGDILAREGPPGRYAERVAATGYLALSRRFGFDSENYQHLTIQDTIDTLGQSVLGLSVGCARCHDHKFDPVSMEDYYGLYGIFASTRYSFPGSEQKMKYRAMSPLVPPAESREKWRGMQAGFAALGLAPAAVLRSLDDPDGDFEMQKVASGGSNGVLVPPWLYEGKVAVSQDAQSPFKHLYPFGIAGARVAPDAGAYRIRQGLPMLPETGVLHVNLEFRVAAGDPAASGRHRFALGPVDGPAVIAVWLSSGQLTLSGGEAPLHLPLSKPGEWHCLQLAIDRQGGTFSGSVGLPGNVTAFEARRLSGAVAIESVTIDSSGAEGRLPVLDLDNFDIQETPVAPVSATPSGLPAAGPTLAELQAELQAIGGMDGDFEAQSDEAPPGLPWHPGPNSAVKIAAASQSPFRNLHAAGTRGIHLPATAAMAYNGFGHHLAKTWDPANADKLHVGFDFRCGNAEDTGTWRFHVGRSHTSAAVELGFNGTELFRRSGDARDAVARLQPGEWHQVQVVLDLKARTYTGSIATRAIRSEFSGDFGSAWEGSIDYLFVDSYGHLAGPRPAVDADNFVISASPLPPLDAPDVTADASASARQAAIAELRRKIDQRRAEDERRRAELDARLAAGPVALAYGVSEGTPHDVPIQIRGEPDKPGAVVPRSFIRALGQAELPAAAGGSGRLELARWLTRPDHPLTARVMVNRIWQYHFGRGLVATSNDFGSRSQPPSHPALLDHLASRFIASGWSVKAMHRMILSSATWQQAGSGGSPQAADFLAAFPRRRLGAEEIRDSILSVSGSLDPEPGGAHPFPPSPGWGYTQHGPFTAVYEHDKRSVYLMVQRIKRHPFLALFDGADPNSSTAERRVTTVPTQALYFLNDPFVHDKALKFAGRLQAAGNDEPRQLELATQLAFGRPPTAAELAEAAEFLQSYRAELGPAAGANGGLEPLAAYLRVLFGSNEFLHCD
jgi:hypothetical protein